MYFITFITIQNRKKTSKCVLISNNISKNNIEPIIIVNITVHFCKNSLSCSIGQYTALGTFS